MSTDSQRLADIRTERSNICPLGASRAERHIMPIDLEDLNLVHRDSTQGSVDRFPGSRGFIQWHPGHFDGGIHRGELIDLAPESSKRAVNQFVRQAIG